MTPDELAGSMLAVRKMLSLSFPPETVDYIASLIIKDACHRKIENLNLIEE
jgi:hypothetical protein